jgi:DNA-directed RNA polymerase subunit RPC12/RpoP
MKSRKCAVCGKRASINNFGDGITCPKTTCLECKARIVEFVEIKTIMFIKRIIRGEV